MISNVEPIGGSPVCTNFWQRDFEALAAEMDARPAAFFLNFIPKYPTTFPGNVVAAVGRKANSTERGMFPLKWGLLPSTANGPDQKPQPVNARSDTVDRYAIFRESLRIRRCLIPANAFFEYTKARPKKRFRFQPVGDSIFAFAGLWDVWGTGAERIYSCTFVTCEAGEVMARIHDRQPVLLKRDAWDAWLDPATPTGGLKALFDSSRCQELEAIPDETTR